MLLRPQLSRPIVQARLRISAAPATYLVATPATVRTMTTATAPAPQPRLGTLSRPSECCDEVRPAALETDAARQHALRFKALADPHRLRVLALLAAQDGPLCVCDIEAQFDLSQPTISHHLRVLRESGFVTATRAGLWVYYALHQDGLAVVQDALVTIGASPDR